MKIREAVIYCFVLLTSCSPRVIEVERPVVIERNSVHFDTVATVAMMHDSVHVREKGDSVIVMKKTTVYVDRWHHTLHTDTVEVPVTVRSTIKVPQPLKPWQQLFIVIGIVSTALLCLVLLRMVRNLFLIK